MKYTIQAFTDNTKAEMIGDWSHIAERVKVGTSERGFDTVVMFIPMSTARAFDFYALSAMPHLVISYSKEEWTGRIEDIEIDNGGVNITAFGYWRALTDTRYTALWSDTSTRRWETVTSVSTFTPEKYQIDFNNRLYIAPRAGEPIDSNFRGVVGYRIPDRSTRDITTFVLTYEFLAPNSTWEFLVNSTDSAFTSAVNELTVTGTGVLITATTTITLSAASAGITALVRYNSGTSTTLTSTGDVYLKITGIRVQTKTGTIYADDIIADIISGIPSTQLSASTALIQSPSLDLEDAIFEDMTPADILADLETRGDSQTPPQIWAALVKGGQFLRFRPATQTNTRQWYTDVQAIELQRTIDGLANSVYAQYEDENGRTLRTTTATSAPSVSTTGIERTGTIRADTTSATQAGIVRDAELDEAGEIRPRSSITVRRVYNASGASVPLIEPKSGDRLTIRNLPNVGAALDNVQTFTIARTSLDLENGTVDIVPSRDLPSIAALLAQALI